MCSIMCTPCSTSSTRCTGMVWCPCPAATYSNAVVSAPAVYTVFYGLPQWLEQSRSMTSAAAEMIILPVPSLGVLATVLATRLISRSGLRPVLMIGSAGLLVGSLSLLAVGAVTPVALLLVAAKIQVSSHVKPRIRGRSIEAATR